jgi:hypothetical protein
VILVTGRVSGSLTMTDEIEASPHPSPKATAPYEKPAIAWEESLDVRATLAAACAKVDPGIDPLCGAGSPRS